jgi:hypothetical protein
MDDDRVDTAERQAHYGAGKQPWDVIVQETPWAVAFAAANVLKYLRRTKAPEHSLQSARWYHKRLREWSKKHPHPLSNAASSALVLLEDKILTVKERQLLEES